MWRPTASIENLHVRAATLNKIRAFFAVRKVLEVETPILAQNTVTNPYIESLSCDFNKNAVLYLQTSPEYHMKRLLAAGIGSIFQISKAFRAEENGRLHNVEFTLLEWYRIGFDHHDLMNEMDELLQALLNSAPAVRYSYQEIFQKYLSVDPLSVSVMQLKTIAAENNLNNPGLTNDRTAWLMYVFSFLLEPKLQTLTFVYDFPAEQASLARLNNNDDRLASRFEVYYKGIELANGFHELTDANEQQQRFIIDLQLREKMKLPKLAIDKKFLQALSSGLPDCAGVALGIDRLIMLIAAAEAIDEVLSFTTGRA